MCGAVEGMLAVSGLPGAAGRRQMEMRRHAHMAPWDVSRRSRAPGSGSLRLAWRTQGRLHRVL